MGIPFSRSATFLPNVTYLPVQGEPQENVEYAQTFNVEVPGGENSVDLAKLPTLSPHIDGLLGFKMMPCPGALKGFSLGGIKIENPPLADGHFFFDNVLPIAELAKAEKPIPLQLITNPEVLEGKIIFVVAKFPAKVKEAVQNISPDNTIAFPAYMGSKAFLLRQGTPFFFVHRGKWSMEQPTYSIDDAIRSGQASIVPGPGKKSELEEPD